MCHTVTLANLHRATNIAIIELESLQDVLQSLQEDVGVVRLEHQGRPQSDGGLATASTVNPLGPQTSQDLVPPGSSVAVDGTESPPASGSTEVLRVASLQLSQTSHEDISSLQGVLQQVVSLDRLQYGVQQYKLKDR